MKISMAAVLQLGKSRGIKVRAGEKMVGKCWKGSTEGVVGERLLMGFRLLGSCMKH